MNYSQLALFIILDATTSINGAMGVGDGLSIIPTKDGNPFASSASIRRGGGRQLQATLKNIIVGGGSNNQLLVDDGNGGFIVSSLPGTYAQSIAFGDFNADGLMDIVFGNYYVANLLLINDGNGGFNDSILPGGTLNTRSVVVGDFDGDGIIDIIIGNDLGGQENQLLVNDGSGSFSVSNITGGGMDTESVAAGDVDGDGDLDIVIGNRNENQLLINNGSGEFTVSVLPNSLETASVAFGDFDGDGDLDIVIGNYGPQNQLLLNDGSGGFTDLYLPGGNGGTTSVAVGDVDEDGDLDIVIGSVNADNQLLLNDGNAGFTESILPGGSNGTQSVAVNDVDEDGDLDILIGNFNTQDNLLLINDGSGGFTDSVLAGGSMSTKSIAVMESPLCAVNEYVSSNKCVTCPAGTWNSAGDLVPGLNTTCSTDGVGPWEINFLEMTTNFDFDSTREVNMTYEIGTGHEYEAKLFDVDCITPVSTPNVMIVNEILEEEGGGIFEDSVDYDFVTLSYDFDKSKIVGSSIWNDSLNQIEFCQVFRLKEGTFVIKEDERKVVIDFDLTASFLAENQALGASSANSETDSAGVNSYIEAYKCGAGANGMDSTTSALVKNDDLVVCIRSKSIDVEIVSLDAMTIDGSDKNGDGASLPVIVNSAPSSSFTSMLYVSSTEVQVLTRVPINEFDFNAEAASITISGGVTAELSGRSLRAQFGKGPPKDKDKVKVKGGAFKLDIALQPDIVITAVEEEELWATSMSVSTAIYVSATKCSMVFGMLIVFANNMW